MDSNVAIMPVKHAYSHVTMTMHVYRAKIISGRPRAIDCADYKWVKVSSSAKATADRPSLEKFAYSKADLHVVAKLQGE